MSLEELFEASLIPRKTSVAIEKSMMEGKAHYVLKCAACGAEYDDKPGEWRLRCDREGTAHGPALLHSVFAAASPRAATTTPGDAGTAAAFAPWLAYRTPSDAAPGSVPAVLRETPLPACYRSTRFGEARLGLRRLWVAFCGFWPARGARLASCTFKELEAACIAARLAGMPRGTGVVVASAGNTARAFAQIFSRPALRARPVVIVAPARARAALWSPAPFAPNVRLVAVAHGDYADAIRLADLVAAHGADFLIPEGGARNNARRDGMSLALLAAAASDAADGSGDGEDARALPVPQHYFQAIGSGTGGIAAWEAAQRLVRAACRATPPPAVTRLHLSQNAPFTPMCDAWAAHARALPAYCDSDAECRRRIGDVAAFVLTNRRPPYGLAGGVYDALAATDGAVHAVTNAEAAAAAALFEEAEGIDVDPAAAVAIAHLCHAVKTGAVAPDDFVVLNVTGGGKRLLLESTAVNYLEPFVTVDAADISPETAAKVVAMLRNN